MEHHELYGGRLHVYKRENSRYWQCSTYLAGRNRRVSTKEESLSHAKEFAEDWYLELKGKHRAGDIKEGKTFRYAAEQFQHEYEIITQGHRSPKYIESQADRIRVHLLPYFGNMVLSEITPGKVQEYRIHRVQTSRTGKPPARSTLHQEIVALRQILKTAQRHGWIQFVAELRLILWRPRSSQPSCVRVFRGLALTSLSLSDRHNAGPGGSKCCTSDPLILNEDLWPCSP